jgi:DNA-binding response OmpR family regulator
LGDRILIVEDDHDLRSSMREALESERRGYTVAEADDCPAALEVLRDTPAGVLAANLQVPANVGVDVIRTIRDEHPNLPVLATGFGDAQHVIDCFDAGAWEYFVKPFSMPNLVGMVRRVLIARNLFRSRPGEFRIVARDGARLEMVVGSEIEYVRRFRRLAELLFRDTVPAVHRTEIRTAIEEIGRNAVEWGNDRDPAKHVRLRYVMDPDRVTIDIEDEGPGFAHDALLDPSIDPVGTVQKRHRAGRRPGGFGIFVTRLAMDEVTFNDKGNAVRLVKRLA